MKSKGDGPIRFLSKKCVVELRTNYAHSTDNEMPLSRPLISHCYYTAISLLHRKIIIDTCFCHTENAFSEFFGRCRSAKCTFS